MTRKKRPLKLGVNIDHVATLRQARGTDYPSPLEAARLCEVAGADGITVHLREDRRHIQEADVRRLRRALHVPLNLEMANVTEIVRLALVVRPEQVCLVPEKRRELTTEGGLDAVGQRRALGPAVWKLKSVGIEVSLFIAPDPRQLAAAAELGAPVVELHTGTYADARGAARHRELRRLIEGARRAHELGLRVNAGHGINLANLGGILAIPWLEVLNIGHSIISRAVLVGIAPAVREMRRAMRAYTGGRP